MHACTNKYLGCTKCEVHDRVRKHVIWFYENTCTKISNFRSPDSKKRQEVGQHYINHFSKNHFLSYNIFLLNFYFQKKQYIAMYMTSVKLIWQKIDKQNFLILYKQRKMFIIVSVFYLKNETSLSIYLKSHLSTLVQKWKILNTALNLRICE